MLDKLRTRMSVSIVEFSYLKKNGEIRVAKGTLMSSICPQIKGGGKPTPQHLQLYFDVEKNAWRSFKKDDLLEVY